MYTMSFGVREDVLCSKSAAFPLTSVSLSKVGTCPFGKSQPPASSDLPFAAACASGAAVSR
jgi:hypothetical protein